MTLQLPRLPGVQPQSALRTAARNAAEPMRFGAFPITETRSFPPPASPECWIYVTLNAEIALALQRCPELQLMARSNRTRVSVDGQWIWWALRRKYPGLPLQKLSGSDLIYDIADHCAREKRRLFLLGASDASNAGAVQLLRQGRDGLQAGGFAMQHFEPGKPSEDEARERSLQAIRAFAPDYVVLALAPDKQYRFAWTLARQLDGVVSGLLCFGGAVDMVSGIERRAPTAWQRHGLESIYRVMQRPSRARRWLDTLRILPHLARGRY